MYFVTYVYTNKINPSANNTWEDDYEEMIDVKDDLGQLNILNFLGELYQGFAAWIAELEISFPDEKVFNYDNEFISLHVRVKKEN